MGAAAEARVTALGYVHEQPEYTTWVVWLPKEARPDRRNLSGNVSCAAREPRHIHQNHDSNGSGQHAFEPSTIANR